MPLVVVRPQTVAVLLDEPVEPRPVTAQGEISLTRSISIPVLDDTGVYVLSSDPQAIQPVSVDDRLDLLVDGRVIFSHDFSMTGSVQSAVLYIPADVVQQMSGRVVTLQLRDVYAVSAGATPIYLLYTAR